MSPAACVLVTAEDSLAWLGPQSPLHWTMASLLEVRGLDRICCFATAKLAPQIISAFAATCPDVPVQTLPPNKAGTGDADIAKWLAARCGTSRILLVRPYHPFLGAAKIEACVEALADNWTECRPARMVKVVGRESGRGEQVQPCPLRGLRALAMEREGCRFKPIEINLIEALDVTDPEERRIAQTLVNAGVV